MLWFQHSHSYMGELLNTLIRIMPWLMTTLSANVIHYCSLFIARKEAHRQFQEAASAMSTRQGRWFPGSDPKDHEQLTFDLMKSPAMRRARYQVKLIRYGCTLLYVALFYNVLPELSFHNYSPGLGTLEGVVVGILSGLVTLYLNENRLCDMRSCWRPAEDCDSQIFGWLWDAVRVAGALSTPVENELFYHSWIYRTLILYLCENNYNSFTEVPFLHWSWLACLTANIVFAIYNGKEWRSSGLLGILSLWATARRGQFLDGILAHAVSRVTISWWVLYTGQRQYW